MPNMQQETEDERYDDGVSKDEFDDDDDKDRDSDEIDDF